MRHRALLHGDRWDWPREWPIRGHLRRRIGYPRERLKRVQSWTDRLLHRKPQPIREGLTLGASPDE